MDDLCLVTFAAAFLFPIPFGSYGVGLSLLFDSLDTFDDTSLKVDDVTLLDNTPVVLSGWGLFAGSSGGSAIDETSPSSCKHFSYK